MTVNTKKRLAQEKIERPDVASPAFIRLKGVVKEYRSEAGSFTALKGINLEVVAGEFLGIIGRSGAGKSTLLNMISAVDHLTSGEVWIGDTQIHALSQTQLSKWRGQTLGVIYQTFQLMPMLTLIDNVMLPIDFCGRYHPLKSVEKAAALLADLDIVEHAYKLPSQISGGQQQRVAIARALANDPALILADEPTGSLDSATATATMKILKRLAERGKTIIVATHDVSLMHYFTRTVMLFDGEIVNEVLVRIFPMVDHQKVITAGRDIIYNTYLPGQPIIKKGEALSGLFIIIHGAAEVMVDGFVNVLSAGEFFGTRGLISGTASPATITASEPAGVEVGVLARTAFLELYRDDKSYHEEMKQRL